MKIIAVLPFICLILNCLSLDSFLFKGEEITEYKYDNWDGETECPDALDSLPFLPDSQYREVSFKSGNEQIAGVFLGSHLKLSDSDTIILYLHGTSLHIDFYWPRTRLIYSTGYPVLIIDYRGYGKSSGTPTEYGIYEDGFSALRFIKDSLGNPDVIVHAFSLGSLIGCELASKNITGKIKALVLESPVGKVETLVQDASCLDLPGSYVTEYKGNNVEKIKNVSIPFLWIHGTEDELLPIKSNGEKIWNNYQGESGFFIIVEDAGHKNVPSLLGYENYIQILKSFFSGNGNSNEYLTAKRN